MATTSPARDGAPGRVRIAAPRGVRIAASSTKVESGYAGSAGSRVSVTPSDSSAAQYASCCARAFATSGTPRSTVVSPSAKLAAGGRTIARRKLIFGPSDVELEEDHVAVLD